MQKAIVIEAPGVAKLVTDRPIPKLRDGYVLVKTVAVALNPADWMHIDFLVQDGGPLVGCDYAGIVEEVGGGVVKPFKKGDRIAGFAHGCNIKQHEDGAFAEYIIVRAHLQIKIPDSITFEDACTLGVGVTTVAQGLYQHLGLAWPTEPVKNSPPVFIYGGSTATGILGIQYAKLSGYKVLVACSKQNFELVKSFGADHVFDYNDPECGKKIRNYTDNNLSIAWNTIGLESAAQICADALSSTGGKYAALSPLKLPRDDVTTSWSLAYSALGQDFAFGTNEFPASRVDEEYADKFWELTEELLSLGRIRAHRTRVENGLEGVLDGLKALKENKVSGMKLVYKI